MILSSSIKPRHEWEHEDAAKFAALFSRVDEP